MPKKFNKQRQAVERRKRVITRLETQLTNGHKTDDKGVSVPLTDKDKSRIHKELETLNARI